MHPQKIGRYEIERELGRGGMAVVYLATDPYIKRKVAIKVLHRQGAANPEAHASFLREAESVASLEHPFIVPIYDFGEENGANFIVMRLMLGGPLTHKLKKYNTLSPDEIINILHRVGSALDAAHFQGIVHRDLKPDNILYDRYKGAFLGDFGIAQFTAGGDHSEKSGAILGTPAYMSPEQFENPKELDGRSDLYALGVIVFEMLTGRQPYTGKTLMELMTKHITEPVPRVMDFNADLSPACQQVIQKAMAKEPADRYDSASEMVHALATSMAECMPNQFSTIEIPIPEIQDDLFTKATAFVTTLKKVVKEKTGPADSGPDNDLTLGDKTNGQLFAKASKFMAVLDEMSRMELALEEARRKTVSPAEAVAPALKEADAKTRTRSKQMESLNVSCPHCKAKISARESDCPHCGQSLIGSLSFH